MKSATLVCSTVLLALLVSAPLALAASNNAAKDTTHNTIKPVGKCLRIDRSPEIYAPDDSTLIARTGPRYYRIDLANACPRLNSATLSLRPTPGKRYMCGRLGEQVINSDGLHCRVTGVTLIDKATFKKLEAKATQK